MSEIWKKIPSFPDYEVSNIGNVRCISDGKYPSVHYSFDGYPKCSLKKDDKRYSRAIHPLVLEAFVGPRQLKHDACHNDGNPKNNRLENLRWDTRRNNCIDTIKHGRSNQGEKHGLSKLTEKQALEIKKKYKTGKYTFDELAEEYGIARSQANFIVRGIQWAHLK